MADEESLYKVEYLEGEEQVQSWVSRSGAAKVTYDSGSIFEGVFNDEKQKHGMGKFTWMAVAEDEEPKVLAVYEGLYKDGKREGLGKMVYPSGDEYRGDWLDNKVRRAPTL